MTGNLILVLGDQLSHDLTSLRDADPGTDRILMAEVMEEGTYVAHHPKKILFILSAMRHFAGELRERNGIEVACIASDLAQPEASAELAKALEQQQIAVTGLINNAGFGDRGQFADLDLQRQLDMVQVNVTALVDLTWRLVPALKQAKDAFVINVASSAAFQAGPNMTIYYATKAFVLSFSEGLHEELKGNGIAVSALCPGATDSEFATEAHMTDTLLFKAGTMTTEAVVKKSGYLHSRVGFQP